MSVWDLRKLQMSLTTKEPGPIFLVVGEDAFLAQEAVRAIQSSAMKDSISDFNSDLFFASDVDPAHVRDTVEMLPMMAKRRLVVLRGVDNWKDKQWEPLFPLFDSPVPSTTFVMVAEKIDKRKKAYKKIYDSGVIVELKRPYENQVPAWIDYMALKRQLTVQPEAAQLLLQFVGLSLAEINNEIGKLHAYLGDRTEITPQDVLQVVSQSRVESVFELAKAIGRGDRAQALTCLADLLEQGQSEVAALALIMRHVRILATLVEGLDQGLSGGKLSAKAGIPQFFLAEYLDQARSWNRTKIRSILKALVETDRALKSSSISAHLWLESFILQTCQRGSAQVEA